MKTLILRILVAFACCAAWCWEGSEAIAQVRKEMGVSFKIPGGLSTIGRGQNYDFRQDAAGVGGLQTTGGGYQAEGVLRSSMADRSQLDRGLRSSIGAGGSGSTALRSGIDRSSSSLISSSSGGGGIIGSTALAAVKRGPMLKGTADFILDFAGGKGMAGALLGQDTSLTVARGFMASVGESSGFRKSDESIKTLVPDQPGQYRDKMHRGEELLRVGSFMSAYEQFKVASDIVGRSPEPLLNMAHARFGSGGYRMTAFYIRRAFTYMPELPLVPLRPKNFYENVAVFGDLIIRLETYLDENPGDGDAQLVLAYFRWFADTPDVPTVRSALEKALAVSKSEERIEAIHIFWEAIVADGKATGKLGTDATTKPKPADTGGSTTQPADRAAKGDKAPRSSVQPAKTSNTAGKAQ